MRLSRLPVPITLHGGEPLVVQIHRALKVAIESGRVREGDPLPSSRDLARTLGVSRNTVLNAVALLVAEGVLETRRGAGTFVKWRARRKRPQRATTAPPHALSEWAKRLPQEPGIVRPKEAGINFLPGVPDLGLFPIDEWRRSATRKLRTLRGRIGAYGMPEGSPELRSAIASYVSRSRAVTCHQDDIIVTSGAQQAFDLLSRALIQRGTPVAVEEPGYRPVTIGLRAAGARIRHIPIDDEGLRVERLPDETRIVYATPSHQYPLGITMSMRRRRELLEWAQRNNAFIVEDDYDSEYQYSKERLPSLQGSDPAGCVIYVGTFSKILLPGIRLGYLVAPAWLRKTLVTIKWLTDRHADQVTQSVLADFMSTGGFAQHVSKMQKIYAERHRTLLDALSAAAIPGLTVVPSHAGLHLCALLDRRESEAEIVTAALARDLGLYGLAETFSGRPSRQGVVFGFGNVPCDLIETGVGRLSRVLREKPSH